MNKKKYSLGCWYKMVYILQYVTSWCWFYTLQSWTKQPKRKGKRILMIDIRLNLNWIFQALKFEHFCFILMFIKAKYQNKPIPFYFNSAWCCNACWITLNVNVMRAKKVSANPCAHSYRSTNDYENPRWMYVYKCILNSVGIHGSSSI